MEDAGQGEKGNGKEGWSVLLSLYPLGSAAGRHN